MVKKNSLWVLTFIFIIYTGAFAAKQPAYFFQKITTTNGLSANYILQIYRDSRGYLWIATNYGLNRYDGKNIKVYHHNSNNAQSLPREEIFHIVEERSGILWMHSNLGLIEFDPETEKFSVHKHKTNDPGTPLANDPCPYIDKDNNLWLSTDKGVQLYDRNKKRFETFLLAHPDSVKKNNSVDNAGTMVEDKDHNLWCFGRLGIYRFDKVKRRFRLYQPEQNLPGAISNLFVDHEGTIWVAYYEGLLQRFHPESGVFETVLPKSSDPGLVFGQMTEWRDKFRVYWLVICTRSGLLFYDYHSGEKHVVRHSPNNSNSLIYNDVYCVYTDHENLLWIGTTKGMNLLDNTNQTFLSRSLQPQSSQEEILVNGYNEAIYMDSEIKMVSFLYAKGLGIYDANWNLIKFHPSIPPMDKDISACNIVDILKDNRGIFWITTQKGLVRFDKKLNKFKQFIPDGIDGAQAKTPMFFTKIISGDSNSLYILSRTLGIYKFDLLTSKFVQYLVHDEQNPKSLPTNNLIDFIKDGADRLIILTGHHGFFIYDPKGNNWQTYNDNADATIREAILNLEVDPGLSGNNLWLNTAKGLLLFNLQTKKFELFNSSQGLANENLFSNEVDNNGNIWVAHNGGISRFDISSHTFSNFSENHGLEFHALNHNMTKTADGTIYVGDRNNLVCFNPKFFESNQTIPQVHINTVKALNEPCEILSDSVSGKKFLTVGYDQDLLTVDFSVLNLSHPLENKFFFRLDDDSTWHQVNDGIVNLVKLAPGSYILHVTGCNDSGVMNQTGDTLYITILPPFYQTWWFRMIVIIGLILLLVEIRRRGINRVKRDENIKTEFNKQLAQAETKALRAQMNPHFIFNSLNSINSFVIDQKHEIASDYLIKFSKLIRLILDNSRSEMISIEKELETLKLYVLLESARFDNKFKCLYHIAEDVNTNSIMIPPMLLQPFVENAIWHGLMQKEDEGVIIVEIKLENEEFLNIAIIDDGIGREKAAELKSKSATHKSHGLKVTSQRIEMMNKLNSTGATVNVIDLKDAEGRALGTKVELIIPF